MEIYEFEKQLINYLQVSGATQIDLSKQAKVPQSQISGWLNGNGKRVSKNSRRVMRVIENYHNSDESPIDLDVAMAVRKFCEGDKKASKTLANLINSLTSIKNK